MGEKREKFVFVIPRNKKNYDIDSLYKTIETYLNR